MIKNLAQLKEQLDLGSVEERDEQAIVLLCASLFQDPAEAANTLATFADLDPPAVISHLAELQKKKICDILQPGCKTVAIFHTASAYRDCFDSLPEELYKRGFNSLVFVNILAGNYLEHGFQTYPYVFYGGHGIASSMDCVDFFVSNDLYAPAQLLPRKPLKGALFHGLDWHDLKKPVNVKEIMRGHCPMSVYFDTFFMPYRVDTLHCDEVMDYVKNVFPRSMINHDSRDVRFIPAGYPKIDRMAEYFRNHGNMDSAILYSPGTKTNKTWDYLAESEKLLREILDSFPDKVLIFRPHPSDRRDAEVLALADSFRNYSHFRLDLTASFLKTYCETAVMISEITSRTALEFSFSTLKPTMFFHPASHSDQRQNAASVMEQNLFGRVAGSVDEAVAGLHTLLDSPASGMERIKSLYHMTIANPGSADEYISDCIADMLHDRERPEWISMPLTARETCETESDYLEAIKRLEQYPAFFQAGLLAEKAVKDFPRSSRLCLEAARVFQRLSNHKFTMQLLCRALTGDMSEMSSDDEKESLRGEIYELVDSLSPRQIIEHINNTKLPNQFVPAYILQRMLYMASVYSPLVLFPGGKHSMRVTRIIKNDIPTADLVVCDDTLECETTMNGYRCLPVSCLQNLKYQAAILSTDSENAALRNRAKELFGEKLIEFYPWLPPGPYF